MLWVVDPLCRGDEGIHDQLQVTKMHDTQLLYREKVNVGRLLDVSTFM